ERRLLHGGRSVPRRPLYDVKSPSDGGNAPENLSPVGARRVNSKASPARRSRSRSFLALVLASALAAACGPPPKPLDLPQPVEVTTLGVGDVFEVHVVGEPTLPVAYTVAPDGTIDFPYIKRIQVAGLEPQDLASLIRKKLVDGQILSDPSVSVSMKEYNSKRVEVIGEVAKPGSIPLVPGMTLLRAISIVG